MLDETVEKVAHRIYRESLLCAMHSLKEREEFDKKFLFHNKDGTETTQEISYNAFEEYLESIGGDFSENVVWDHMDRSLCSVLAMHSCDIVTKIYDGFMTYDIGQKEVLVTAEKLHVDKKLHPFRHCNKCIVVAQHIQKQEITTTRVVPYTFEEGVTTISDTVFKI